MQRLVDDAEESWYQHPRRNEKNESKGRRNEGSIRSGKAKTMGWHKGDSINTERTQLGLQEQPEAEDVLPYSTKPKTFTDIGNSDTERRKRRFQITAR
jgi:hypothetical protein